MRCLDVITDSTDMGLGKLREMVKDKEAWHATGHGVTKSRTRLNNKGLSWDIWPFLGPETQSADQKTWKATEWHFLEAHEFSTSFGGHKCTVGIRFGEKITNYAHFPLFLHFKSEK